jgi:hypothetical protein
MSEHMTTDERIAALEDINELVTKMASDNARNVRKLRTIVFEARGLLQAWLEGNSHGESLTKSTDEFLENTASV